MSTSSGHTPAEWAAKARREQAAPDLLASCQELREALACAMRVIYAYSRESDVVPAALAFVAELEQMGIKDGIGVRADAAITAAGGKS